MVSTRSIPQRCAHCGEVTEYHSVTVNERLIALEDSHPCCFQCQVHEALNRCAHCAAPTMDRNTTKRDHLCCRDCQYVVHPAPSARQKAVEYE